MAGKSHRKGISLAKISELFATEEQARVWLENRRWTKGVSCPFCNGKNIVRLKHPTQTHRCKDCRNQKTKNQFNVKTDIDLYYDKNSTLHGKLLASIELLTRDFEGNYWRSAIDYNLVDEKAQKFNDEMDQRFNSSILPVHDRSTIIKNPAISKRY